MKRTRYRRLTVILNARSEKPCLLVPKFKQSISYLDDDRTLCKNLRNCLLLRK